MTSFELVNQKLKHIFGGIQPQINGSIEFLYAQHRRISLILQNSSAIYRKLQNACQVIKQSMQQLQEIYKSQLKESNTIENGSLGCMVGQIIKYFGNWGDEVEEIRRRMDLQLDNYLPSIKKQYASHKEAAQQLEHYRSKVGLLQKRVGQVDANDSNTSNIKTKQNSEDNIRFLRNKQKLKTSQQLYDSVVQKLGKKCTNFNNDSEKLFLSNYADFLNSTISLNQKTRISIINWLASKQKKCTCFNIGSVKVKIQKIIKSQHCQKVLPINILKLYSHNQSFKDFDNLLSAQVNKIKKQTEQSLLIQSKSSNFSTLKEKKSLVSPNIAKKRNDSEHLDKAKLQQFFKSPNLNTLNSPKAKTSQFDQFTNLIDL